MNAAKRKPSPLDWTGTTPERLAAAAARADHAASSHLMAAWDAEVATTQPLDPTQDVAEWAERDIPEPAWLVRSLGWCPGAPHLVAGYGYSGKTTTLQAAAVAIATGRPLWGYYASRRGRVLHLDFEQGARLTLEKYQRLIRAAGVSLPPDTLRLRSLPSYRVGIETAEMLRREIDGFDLVIIDSLRAAAPGIDENDSRIREPLDMLGEVSIATNATIVVVHHARKPSVTDSGASRYAIRGSGAIYDACSSVLVMHGDKGQPPTVSHEKARELGQVVDDFCVAIRDVAGPTGPRWGLEVATFGAEVARAAREAAKAQQAQQAEDRDARMLLDWLRRHPGASLRGIISGAESAGLSVRAARRLTSSLRGQGVITVTTEGPASRHYVSECDRECDHT
jgi:hypothetical protein